MAIGWKRALALAGVAVCLLAGTVAVSLISTGRPLFSLIPDDQIPVSLQGLLAAPDGDTRARPAPDGAASVPRVEVARVVRQRVPQSLVFSGRAVAQRDVALRSRVTGYLEAAPADEAAFVSRGDVLFELDQRTFQARVNELSASLEGARSRVEFLDREVGRIAELEEEEFAARSRLDELRTDLLEARSAVQELRAALDRAELDLSFATITAPFDGKVGFFDVDVGDLVTAGETVLTRLVSYNPIEVEFRPSAGEVARIRAAMDGGGAPLGATVTLDGGAVRDGTVEALGPAFDTTSNTLAVRAILKNRDAAIVPGQFGRVRVALGETPALLVPSVSLVATQDRRAVYRIGPEGTVSVVPVETGRRIGELTVVTGDLRAGEQVATGRLQSLREGMTVRGIEPSEDATTTGSTAKRARAASP